MWIRAMHVPQQAVAMRTILHASAARASLRRRQAKLPVAPRHHRAMSIDLDALRRYAVARTLFTPTTLPKAIERLGFVQADPIRAPARAQDLTLRHRVRDYRAGDLERRYPRLAVEEDFFVNYGFVPRATQALMHPRTRAPRGRRRAAAQAQAVLDFVRERGVVHPREVDAHFAARQGTQLVRRLLARQHAAARCHALPRAAARGTARGRHALLRGARSHARGRRPRARAGRAGRRAGGQVRAAARGLAELPDQPAGRRRAAVGRTAARRAGARPCAPGPCRGRRRRLVLAGRREPGLAGATRRTTRCACWRPSTRWSGTAAASSCCGAGPIASRPTRRRRSACAATTRCRCCGATGSSAGATWRSAAARLQADIGYVAGRAPRDARLPPRTGRRTRPRRAVPAAALSRSGVGWRRASSRRCTTSAKPRPRSDGVT